MLGVTLHTINVSRISPLELEGVQMPTAGRLELLLATHWNSMKDGDIVLLDEFLRGFPEVYNGLLDILTSRWVAGFKLPDVVFFAASNSTTSYDAALGDRLHHIPVDDPRYSKHEHLKIRKMIVDGIGLHPRMVDSSEMDLVMTNSVLPMYNMMDRLEGNKSGARVNSVTSSESGGLSPRNLIGQAKLRYVTDQGLASLINASNAMSSQRGHGQYVVVYNYKSKFTTCEDDFDNRCQKLLDTGKLTQVQSMNLKLNIELFQAEKMMRRSEYDDDTIFD